MINTTTEPTFPKRRHKEACNCSFCKPKLKSRPKVKVPWYTGDKKV